LPTYAPFSELTSRQVVKINEVLRIWGRAQRDYVSLGSDEKSGSSSSAGTTPGSGYSRRSYLDSSRVGVCIKNIVEPLYQGHLSVGP
jgi:hypothetical protein